MVFPTLRQSFHASVQQVPFSWGQKGKGINQSLTLPSIKFSLPEFMICFCLEFMSSANDHWYFKDWGSLITQAVLQLIYLKGNSKNQIMKGIMTGIVLTSAEASGFGFSAQALKHHCFKICLHQVSLGCKNNQISCKMREYFMPRITLKTCSLTSVITSRQILSFPKAEEESVSYLDLFRVSPR